MARRTAPDPRVSRAAYDAAAGYGPKLTVLVDGIYRAVPRGNVQVAWPTLPAGHRAVFALFWAMAEIANGSLALLYSNSFGDLAPALPGAARLVGADAYAALFERANELFADGTLTNRTLRNEELEAFDVDGRVNELDRLSDELYALDESDDSVFVAILDYAERHAAEFFTD